MGTPCAAAKRERALTSYPQKSPKNLPTSRFWAFDAYRAAALLGQQCMEIAKALARLLNREIREVWREGYRRCHFLRGVDVRTECKAEKMSGLEWLERRGQVGMLMRTLKGMLEEARAE
jgi:hypothetical protein